MPRYMGTRKEKTFGDMLRCVSSDSVVRVESSAKSVGSSIKEFCTCGAESCVDLQSTPMFSVKLC